MLQFASLFPQFSLQQYYCWLIAIENIWLILKEQEEIGKFGYSDITYEEACTIEKHSNVKEISIIKDLGNYKNITRTDAFYVFPTIVGCDENAINNLIKNNLVDGRLPENSNEVVVDTNNNFDKIGDTLVQTLESGETKEYTVVGKINNYYYGFFNSNEAITLLNRNDLQPDDRVTITIISNNIKEIYNDYFDIYYQLGSYRNNQGSTLDEMVRYNKTLLEYANVLDYTSDFQKNIYALEGVFVGIIVVSSMIFIYSVINISVIERKRYFGILKSVGTTTSQMKRSIRIELLIILIVTIPLGILIGIGLDCLLITLINNMLPELTTSYSTIFNFLEANEEMNVAIPMSTIGISILIIIITVYVSSILPIKKVSRLQAISLIKQNKEKVRIKKTQKMHRENLDGKHIESKLAFKNIERYKARYSAIIMSLIISIALIIVSNYYIVNITANTYDPGYNYEIGIMYDESKHDNLIEKIIDDIQEAGIADKLISNSFTGYTMVIDEKDISDEEKEAGNKLYGEENPMYPHFELHFASDEYDYNDVLELYTRPMSILTLNEDAYNKYLQEIGVDKLEKNECIFVDYINEKTKYYDNIKLTNYNEGDEILLTNLSLNIGDDVDEFLEEDVVPLKIKKITDKIPQGLSTQEYGPVIIGTEDTIEYIQEYRFGESNNDYEVKYEYIFLQVSDIDSANQFLENIKEKYSLNDYDEDDLNNRDNDNSIRGHELTSQDEIDTVMLLRNIFIYSFIVIITLIGILNMYNAINTNLETRKREVVSLITIGMEGKQINKMLFIENAICGVLALILGIAFGLFASYIVYFISIDYSWYAFEIPWLSLIISAIGIILVTVISTMYLKKKIFADNLVEVLKREESWQAVGDRPQLLVVK